MVIHIDKKLTLISGASDVKIKNLQSNFQNYLHDRFDLDQSAYPIGLSLNSVSVDLQFQSPICSIDENCPQFIVTTIQNFKKENSVLILPITVTKEIMITETKKPCQIQQDKWVIKENDINKNSISLFNFTNDQKFYLKSH